jgi:hypothetical protein
MWAKPLSGLDIKAHFRFLIDRMAGMQYLGRIGNRYSHLITPKTIGLIAAMGAFALSLFRGIQNLGIADGQGYVDQANGILKGTSYVFNHPSAFGHNLGFSFLIALTFIISHSTSLVLLKALLAVSHGIAAYLLAQIGRGIGLGKGFWVASGVFFSLDPFVLLAATSVGTENITTLIVVYWCHLYMAPAWTRSCQLWRVLLFTFSGLFAISMRPNFLLPFFFVSILLFLKWRNEAIQISTLVLSTSLFVLFFSLYEVFLTRLNHAFVFLATYGGFGVGYACRPEFIRQYLGIASAGQNARINHWLNIENPLQASIISRTPSLSPVQIDHEMMRMGISTCLQHPLQSLGILSLKFFAIWRPFTVWGSYGLKILVFSALILIPITYGTVRFLFRRKLPGLARPVKKFFIVISMGFVPSLLITTEQLRHRLAFAEPFYWIFSMACVQYWLASKFTRHEDQIKGRHFLQNQVRPLRAHIEETFQIDTGTSPTASDD